MFDPVVLFFVFGFLAGLAKSPIKLPRSCYEFLTAFLLISIGLKGGIEFSKISFGEIAVKSIYVIAMGTVLPLFAYPVLRKIGKLQRHDAASIAAHYGSVSVGTFAVAIAFLQSLNIPFESYTTLFVVLLEIPAIIVGIGLAKGMFKKKENFKESLHEVLFGKSIVLLLVGLAIGIFAKDGRLQGMETFFFDNFKGALALFLLEMGCEASKQVKALKNYGLFLLFFAVIMPIASALLGVTLGHYMGLSVGGSTILAVLAASSSYIAVPAAMKVSVPEANSGLSLSASLGVTFPFNVVFGIPLYYKIAQALFNT